MLLPCDDTVIIFAGGFQRVRGAIIAITPARLYVEGEQYQHHFMCTSRLVGGIAALACTVGPSLSLDAVGTHRGGQPMSGTWSSMAPWGFRI